VDLTERRFEDEDFERPRTGPPLSPPAPAKPSGSLLSVFMAGVGALVIAVVLGLLMIPVAGVALAAVVLVFVLVALAAFHYVVWGWWLSNAIREDVEAEERAEAEEQRQQKYYRGQ
jgi:hypothetical protein